MVLTYRQFTIEYTLSKNNVHIVDSYKVTRRADMQRIINLIRKEAKKKGYNYKRFASSWLVEWRAHNYMYQKGIERARTGSVDLNEDERKWKLLTYSWMSARYKG